MLDLPFDTTTAAIHQPTFAVTAADSGGGGGLLSAAASAIGLGGGTDEWQDALSSLTVDCGLLPHVDVVTVHVANDERAPSVALGDALTVALGQDGENSDVFTGTVETIRHNIMAGTRITLVNGAGRLARMRLNQTFQDQTAGDIVSELANSAEITPNTTAGSNFPFYIVDAERTLLQHIAHLAVLTGHVALMLPDGSLSFAPPATGVEVQTFVYAEDILALNVAEIEPRIAGAVAFGEGAASTSSADAWAWLTKEPLRGEVGDEPLDYIQSGALRTTDTATTAANAQLQATITLAGELTVLGAPAVTVGTTIGIENAPNDQFNGTFFVRRVRHRLDKRTGFTTRLAISSVMEGGGGGLLGGLF